MVNEAIGIRAIEVRLYIDYKTKITGKVVSHLLVPVNFINLSKIYVKNDKIIWSIDM